jgi:thiol-disulfide isomerase/thioredoxin
MLVEGPLKDETLVHGIAKPLGIVREVEIGDEHFDSLIPHRDRPRGCPAASHRARSPRAARGRAAPLARTTMLEPREMDRAVRFRRIAMGALCVALLGCSNEGSSAPPPPEPPVTQPARPAGGRVEWLAAPDSGDVAQAVGHELARAKADGRDLLVYVGATWCEPCQRFHQAAEKGELNGVFPRLRVLEFDLDRDRDRLAAAGYASRMIPLFVAPNDDGTGSERRIEGSVKGEAAVMDIAGRLRRILPRPSASAHP